VNGIEWDSDTTAYATSVLDEMTTWRLPDSGWAQVAAALERMAGATGAPDFREAVADLEMCGSVRAVPIGATPPSGAPDQVLDLRNRLVHTLTAERKK
jgi:hypothetical protein